MAQLRKVCGQDGGCDDGLRRHLCGHSWDFCDRRRETRRRTGQTSAGTQKEGEVKNWLLAGESKRGDGVQLSASCRVWGKETGCAVKGDEEEEGRKKGLAQRTIRCPGSAPNRTRRKNIVGAHEKNRVMSAGHVDVALGGAKIQLSSLDVLPGPPWQLRKGRRNGASQTTTS